MLFPSGEWHYNRYGHVEICFEDERSVYLQCEDDVLVFFATIGLSPDEVGVDDWDVLSEPVALEYYEVSSLEAET